MLRWMTHDLLQRRPTPTKVVKKIRGECGEQILWGYLPHIYPQKHTFTGTDTDRDTYI